MSESMRVNDDCTNIFQQRRELNKFLNELVNRVHDTYIESVLKAGSLSYAEGVIEGTDTLQSLGRRAGKSNECSQMEKIRGIIKSEIPLN